MAAETLESRGPELLARICGLSKRYAQGRWLSRQKFLVQALDDVNLEIRAGTTLALVGESGCGKSTLARCLARLEEPDSGEIWFERKNLMSPLRNRLAGTRRKIQLIFQDVASALNPRFTAVEIIAEPLVLDWCGTHRELRERVQELMSQVGLLPQWVNRLPHEFSGGQRQRLAIARALALRPKLLILDEALAGLDVSIQAQLVNLLLDLQVRHSLTYLYISHELSLVGHLADEVAVMKAGRIIEQAKARDLLAQPQTLYTRSLWASVLRV